MESLRYTINSTCCGLVAADYVMVSTVMPFSAALTLT